MGLSRRLPSTTIPLLPPRRDHRVHQDRNWQRLQHGPVCPSASVQDHISPIGLIPTKDPRSFQLTHDLSHAAGTSINENTTRHHTAVIYETIDMALICIVANALIANADVVCFPHCFDLYYLLSFMFDGKYYILMTNTSLWIYHNHALYMRHSVQPPNTSWKLISNTGTYPTS